MWCVWDGTQAESRSHVGWRVGNWSSGPPKQLEIEREKKNPEKRAIEGENSPQILGWLWHGAWLQEAQGGNTAGRLKVLRRDFYSCVHRADRFSCSNLINLEWFGKQTRLFPNKSYTKPPRYQVEWPAIKQNNMQISSEENNTIQNLGNVSVTPMSNI